MSELIILGTIDVIGDVLIFVIIVDTIVSFFLTPYHPVRAFLDKIVQPMLAPIRKIVPLVGAFDFSPVILILLIQLLAAVLKFFIHSL